MLDQTFFSSLSDLCPEAPDGYSPPERLSGMPEDTPLLVAFSGGLDSSVLLFLSVLYAMKTGAPLRAIHVHHGIRGREADRDAEFCRKVADLYRVPFSLVRLDVPSAARESGESLEAAARRMRYAALYDCMEEHHIPLLLTAHHANDNLETVLHRLLRGSGLTGLCGIPPCRTLDSGRLLLRTLLKISRASLVAFADQYHIPYVVDSTNRDTAYTRNRIRETLVPLLSQITAEPERAVTRMTEALREDRDCLDAVAAELRSRAENDDGLSLDALRDAHPAIAKRVLLAYWKEQIPALDSYESSHLSALLAFSASGRQNDRLSLPGAVATILSGRLTITPPMPTAPIEFSAVLHEGENPIPARGISIALTRNIQTKVTLNTENIYNSSTQIHLCSATIKGRLIVRARQSGDRIFSRGMHRSVRTLANAAHLSLADRVELCIIAEVDNDGKERILWIPGLAVCDPPKGPTEAPTDVYTLTLYRSTGAPVSHGTETR